MQPPHRRSQVKQRSRLARAVFQGGRNVGGLPGQGPPPDVSQVGIEVTWEEGKLHQESCDLMWSPSRGNGEPGAHLTPALRAPSPSIQRSVALSLPVPWIAICSGRPGSSSRPQVPSLGRRCFTRPWGGSSLQHFHGEQPLVHAAMGAMPSAVLSLLDFSSSVRLCVPHALIGSGALSLLEFGDVWQFFSFIASICNTIGPSYISCGRRRGRREGEQARPAGAHTRLHSSPGH